MKSSVVALEQHNSKRTWQLLRSDTTRNLRLSNKHHLDTRAPKLRRCAERQICPWKLSFCARSKVANHHQGTFFSVQNSNKGRGPLQKIACARFWKLAPTISKYYMHSGKSFALGDHATFWMHFLPCLNCQSCSVLAFNQCKLYQSV